MNEPRMVDKETWKEFRDTGMLWWINRLLHTFGWAICIELDDDGNITSGFPARVKFRGFAEANEEAGFKKVSAYMTKNAEELEQEANE